MRPDKTFDAMSKITFAQPGTKYPPTVRSKASNGKTIFAQENGLEGF
jgi:hypothetical protein